VFIWAIVTKIIITSSSTTTKYFGKISISHHFVGTTDDNWYSSTALHVVSETGPRKYSNCIWKNEKAITIDVSLQFIPAISLQRYDEINVEKAALVL
jgi:hypothetical protein